jgi:hypothetical protein
MTTYRGKFKTDYKSYVIVQVGNTIFDRLIGPEQTARAMPMYIGLAVVEKNSDMAVATPIADGEESGYFEINHAMPDHFDVTLFKEYPANVSG